MTSRERVLEAIAHKPTDRAPADFGAHRQVTDALVRKLGVTDAEELLQVLGVDMRRIGFDYGCRVMQHSCGSVRDIIPFLIEDGVDILDPVQVAASGMGLAGLVRDFGRDLCFHGGVDTQRTLPFGSPEEVRAEVRSYLAITRGLGGYILCGSQEFIEDIPLENILALYDENLKGCHAAPGG